MIESLIGLTIFVLVAVGFYGIYHQLNRFNATAKARIIATAIGNEEIELLRNAPYTTIGTIGGIPNGVFPQAKTINRSNVDFTINLVIRSIDDPFDGTINSTSKDTSPADYKLAQVTVSCLACRKPIVLTTHIAPKNLESTGNNGALFIQVIDAAGQPVSGATVHIANAITVPVIDITDMSDTAGRYAIVDAPPANQSYAITVNKNGYSTEQTYPPGDQANPNPVHPHATVVAGQVTQVTLAIDKTSTLNMATQTNNCSSIGGIPFTISGAKPIGTNPDVLKFQLNSQTDPSGSATLAPLEWDSYQIAIQSLLYDFGGSIPTLPINLAPDSTQNVTLILEPKTTNSLLVTVKDGATGLPLTGATVNVSIASQGYDQTQITGQGFVSQTDWSGGPGQPDFIDQTKFFESAHVHYSTVPGQITIDATGQGQGAAPEGTLTSSSFDFGSTTASLTNISWEPATQSQGNGNVRFQIATNNDNATWNFFGPDGTSSTYYTSSNSAINPIHDNQRHLRYRVYLAGGGQGLPIVSDAAVTYANVCAPPGQIFFSNTPSGNAQVTVSIAGYQTAHETLTISGAKRLEVILQPL